MAVYPADQVAAIQDPEARAVLSRCGLPDSDVTSFRAAQALTPYGRDDRYLVIGMWNIDEIPICVHIVDGSVLSAAPWSDEMDPVNSSVRAFAESLAVLDSARPLSRARYGTMISAGDHVLAMLTGIDPTTLENPMSFWLAIVDDIKNGNYAE